MFQCFLSVVTFTTHGYWSKNQASLEWSLKKSSFKANENVGDLFIIVIIFNPHLGICLLVL